MAGKIINQKQSIKKTTNNSSSSSSKTRSSLSSLISIKPKKLLTPKIKTKSQKEAQKSRDLNSREFLNSGENDFRAALMLGFNIVKPEIELPLIEKKVIPEELKKGGESLAGALDGLSWS